MFFRKRPFISKKDEKKLVESIALLEGQTSGEVRIHIENKKIVDMYTRALKVFHLLKMNQTKQHNGILIYVNPKHKRVVIIADEGINQLVKNDFWDKKIETITDFFKQGEYLKGLLKGVEMIGEVLKVHFPYQSDDVNELPNDISR